MRQKRKAMYLILALVLLFNYALVFAENNIGNLKKEKKDTLNELEKTRKERKKLKNIRHDLSRQIEELDKEIDKASIELEKVEKELDILNSNIDKTLKELKEAENKISEKRDTFNSRLRVMYKNGSVGYMEVLLSAANIGELLTRKDMIQSIVNHDVELLKYMKKQRNIINNKKTQLQAQRASVEVTKTKLSNRKKSLQNATRAKELAMKRVREKDKQYEEKEDELTKFAKEIESKILKLQVVSGPYSGGIMAWPVPSSTSISSYYGYRIHPIYRKKKLHTGIDIRAGAGQDVVAANDGTVIYSGNLGGYGKAVMIDHGGGIVTLYGHNSSLTVSKGTQVKKGDTIAKIGSTGVSTGPHCHFEVRKNGAYVDPIPWLKGK